VNGDKNENGNSNNSKKNNTDNNIGNSNNGHNNVIIKYNLYEAPQRFDS
jgi:hypothetical protein